MSTYTGKYSGSGKNPIPAKGSYCEDDSQDTGDQKQPKVEDWAGGRTAPQPRVKTADYIDTREPSPKASS